MGTVDGSPPPIPPRRSERPPLPRTDQEALKSSPSIVKLSKGIFGKMKEMGISFFSSEATQVTAKLNKIYGGEKNSLPFYGFALYGEVKMPDGGGPPEFPAYGIKMGNMFDTQKKAFLESLKEVKDPLHKNWLLKRFDNYRTNVFVAYANKMINNPAEMDKIFEKFKKIAENLDGGRKTFAEEVQQVLKAERQGKILDKGDWSKKIL